MLFIAVSFVIAVTVFVALRIAFASRPLSVRNFFFLYLATLAGIAMISLGLTGRLHWLFVLLGTTLLFLGSMLRWSGKLWRRVTLINRCRTQSRAQSGHVAQSNKAITEKDALEILGLETGTCADKVKLAHRKIIRKLHPDYGGSTFLAAQVNEAKGLLFKK